MKEIFRFVPHMQPTLWGGNRISQMKGIQSTENIGESWEISGVVDCPFFTTSVIDVDGLVTLDYSHLDSFVILMGVRGKGTVSADGKSEAISVGQTLLLPATAGDVTIKGELRLLEVFCH